MRKLLLVLSTVFILTGLAFAPVNENKSGVDANEDVRETVSLTFVVNEAAYGTLQRQSGERGISAEEFGRWIIDNVFGSIQLGNLPWFEPDSYQLVMMSFDANGRVAQEHSLVLRKSGGEKIDLPRDIVSVLSRFFPEDKLFPEIGQTFFKEDSIFPRGAVGSGSSAELMREFSSNAGQLMQRASAGMDNPAGIGFILYPHPEHWDPEVKVRPGAVLFIKNTATS